MPPVYIGRHGTKQVAKAALIGAVPRKQHIKSQQSNQEVSL